MSLSRHYIDYVRDMLDMAQTLEQFVADMDYDEFIADRKTQLAVTRGLEVIGEAARYVPPEQRARYPNVDWRGMTGMRDWLVHAYFATRLDIVWETVQQHIPHLITYLTQMLADAEAGAGLEPDE